MNITNDHIDWHGNMKNYINSKFKIFKNQNKKQFALIHKDFVNQYKKRNLHGRLVIPKTNGYKKLKTKLKNHYLKSDINDENKKIIASHPPDIIFVYSTRSAESFIEIIKN